MLAIKLRPVGKKKQISYRVVVMEKKSKLVGKFIEDLGWYNPHTKLCALKQDRIEYWTKSGAQPTDTVHNILVREKVREGPKIAKHGRKKGLGPPAGGSGQGSVEQKVEATEPVVEAKTVETEVVAETPVEAPVEAQAEAVTE